MPINKAAELVKKYNDEFSLLYNRYADLNIDEAVAMIREDWCCMKQYLQSDECENEGKASNFEDFLKQLKFYVEGKGSTWPANFQDFRSHITQKLLSEETRRIVSEILARSNG